MQVNHYNFLILAVLAVSEQCWPPGLNSFENQLPSELPEWIGELRWIGHQERHSRKLRTFCVALVHWTPRMFGPHTHTNTCFTRRYLNTRSSAHRPQELTDLGRKLAMMPLHPLCPGRWLKCQFSHSLVQGCTRCGSLWVQVRLLLEYVVRIRVYCRDPQPGTSDNICVNFESCAREVLF